MASGMAAVFASLMCQLKAGDHVIANRVLFGSNYYIITDILPRFGITYTLVEGGNAAAWQKAFRKNTRLVFVETPANPHAGAGGHCCRGEAVQKRQRRLLSLITCSPRRWCSTRLALGADIVVYSTHQAY